MEIMFIIFFLEYFPKLAYLSGGHKILSNNHQSGSQLKSCVGKSSQRSKGGRPRKCGKQGGSKRLRWIGAVLLHPSSMPPPPPRTAAMAAISERNIGTERSGNMYFLKVKLISQNVLYRDQCDNTKILTEHIYVMVHLRNWLLCIITCFYT